MREIRSFVHRRSVLIFIMMCRDRVVSPSRQRLYVDAVDDSRREESQLIPRIRSLLDSRALDLSGMQPFSLGSEHYFRVVLRFLNPLRTTKKGKIESRWNSSFFRFLRIFIRCRVRVFFAAFRAFFLPAEHRSPSGPLSLP